MGKYTLGFAAQEVAFVKPLLDFLEKEGSWSGTATTLDTLLKGVGAANTLPRFMSILPCIMMVLGSDWSFCMDAGIDPKELDFGSIHFSFTNLKTQSRA